MNKLTNTAMLLFLSVLSFAQRAREVRSSSELSENVREGQFGNMGPDQQASTVGGNVAVPVDQYMYLLIAVAVILIAYVAYRRMQNTSKAV